MRKNNIQNKTEYYHFTTNGNLQAYMYENLLYVHYGYDGGTTRTYKYSFDLNPNWVNGRLEAVNFNPHTAMFYPNSYLNFNQDGHYTKHYYNGMERIASRLGDRNLQIHTHAPELQDRKDQLDSNIRRNIVDITGYEFLEPGEEQNHEDPKPVFELPQVGMNGLHPIGSGDVYYYHPNHLGSTCYVTDGNASVQQGFLYAPFGEITNEYNSGWQNGTLPKYSFNAKELDEETGMYYYEARYMAPPVFTSRDRLFEKYPFMSPYGYCMNNPIKYIDPSGDSIIIFGRNGESVLYERNMHYNGSSEFIKSTISTIEDVLSHSETAARMIKELCQSDYRYEIWEGEESSYEPSDQMIICQSGSKECFYEKGGGKITWNTLGTYNFEENPKGNNSILKCRPSIGLFHELGHAWDHMAGYLAAKHMLFEGLKISEWMATRTENAIRKEIGIPLRTSYEIIITDRGTKTPSFTRLIDSERNHRFYKYQH